jgi:hypothetical protein
MAFTHGRLTVIKINGVDISAFTDNTEEEDGVETHDVTTYGALRKAYSTGLGDGTFTIGGTYDDGATGPRAILKPLLAAGTAPVEFIYRPEGTGAGKTQMTVNVLVSSYKQTSPVGEMVKWTAELQMSGNVTEADQV